MHNLNYSNKKRSISKNRFSLGVFFLIWATNAFVLFGTVGKFFSLTFGIYLIVSSVFVSKMSLRFFIFILKSVTIFCVFIFLARELHQETSSLILMIFGAICLILFITGYAFSMNSISKEEIDTRVVLLIAGLVIISSLKLYTTQVVLLDSLVRNLGEDSLNSVGVAYVHGQLFLFLFWFYNKKNNITAESIKKEIGDILQSVYEKDYVNIKESNVGGNLKKHLKGLNKKMKEAAEDLEFEEAARIRDEIRKLEASELEITLNPKISQYNLKTKVYPKGRSTLGMPGTKVNKKRKK